MPFIKQNHVNEMQYALKHYWPPLLWKVHVVRIGLVTQVAYLEVDVGKKANHWNHKAKHKNLVAWPTITDAEEGEKNQTKQNILKKKNIFKLACIDVYVVWSVNILNDTKSDIGSIVDLVDAIISWRVVACTAGKKKKDETILSRSRVVFSGLCLCVVSVQCDCL